MKYPELECSICGYIPDDIDINITDYHLNTCETCGQQNVCDLCLHYEWHPQENKPRESQCPICDDFNDLVGIKRKFYLDIELPNSNLRKELGLIEPWEHNFI